MLTYTLWLVLGLIAPPHCFTTPIPPGIFAKKGHIGREKKAYTWPTDPPPTATWTR